MRRWVTGIALLGLVIAGCSSGGTERATVVNMMRPADAEVVFDFAASNRDIDRVRELIRRSPLVRRFAFLTREESWGEYQRIFATEPGATEGLGPQSVPETFRVQLDDPTDAKEFRRTFTRLAGVDFVRIGAGHTMGIHRFTVGERFRSCGRAGDAEVFLSDAADATDQRGIAAAIRARPEVETARFITHDDAGRFARCALLQSDLGGAELPMSFVITVRPGAAIDPVAAALVDLPGVDEVRVSKAARDRAPAV